MFAFYNTGEGLWRFGLALLVMMTVGQVISTLAFMFSCFNMKPAAATILTLSILFADFILYQIPFFRSWRPYSLSHHFFCWMRAFRDYIPWWSLAESLAYFGILITTFWVIGLLTFRRRDFKS